MSVSIDITESQLFAALRLAILPLFNAEVIKGLNNDVAQPINDYIVITPIINKKEGTNHREYGIDFKKDSALYTYTIQIDCYGIQSGNMASVLNLLFWSDYFIDHGLTTLYSTSPKQIWFDSPDREMIERWSQDVDVSYNPAITLTQDSANALNINLLNPADVFTS